MGGGDRERGHFQRLKLEERDKSSCYGVYGLPDGTCEHVVFYRNKRVRPFGLEEMQG